MKRFTLFAVLLCLISAVAGMSQTRTKWRSATPAELQAVLPARAPVEKERIETEMRTATGIVNDRGQLVAAVVLITAGYAADGKYSHYLLAQTGINIGAHLALPAGAYVVGWKRREEGLEVHFYEAFSGAERGAELAHASASPGRVESFRIWPPSERSVIQIGRFVLPYSVGN